MLGKLFKYEWQSASRMFFLIHGVMLIFAVLSRIFLEVSGGINSDSTIAALLIFAMVMVIGSTVLFTWIFVAYRFYKSVFTDQGYLTNTLPVTPQQIIFGKGLVGVILQVIDLLLVLLAILILVATGDMLADLMEGLSELPYLITSNHAQVWMWFTLISVILTPFVMLIQTYFSIAAGNLFQGHKVLGAVTVFIGIYIVQQVLSTAFLGLTRGKFLEMSSSTSDGVQFSMLTESLQPSMIFGLIFSIFCMVLFFFGTKYIMTRKLNLQ